MIKLRAAKCPNCGADIDIDTRNEITKCKYCNCTVLVEGLQKITKRKPVFKDEACIEISKKLNKILELYAGSKNEMLLMLKDKIGLVNSGKTTAKIAMMKTANEYKEEEFDEPFTYRIGDRTLDHFEYKTGGVVEMTYEADEDGYFAVEYYGKIKKYEDKNELSIVLDDIIENVKEKFKKEN